MGKDDIPTFEEMIKGLRRNPLRGLQLARKANASVNQIKYEIAGIAIAYARMLIDDEEHRDDFYEEEVLAGPAALPPQQAAPARLYVFVRGT